MKRLINNTVKFQCLHLSRKNNLLFLFRHLETEYIPLLFLTDTKFTKRNYS